MTDDMMAGRRSTLSRVRRPVTRRLMAPRPRRDPSGGDPASSATARQRTLVALRESEARFQATFEPATIGMMLIGTDGHPFQVNRALVTMLGTSKEELCAVTFIDFTHPDEQEECQTLFRQVVSGEIERCHVECRFIHKQGHVVWGRVSAWVVRDADGQVLYVVGHVEDITERKRLEQEREAARLEAERHAEELDRVLEQLADGLTVYDAQGRLVRTNAAQRRLLGLDSAPPGYFDHVPLADRVTAYELRDGQGLPLAGNDSPVMRALRGEVTAGVMDAAELRVRTLDGRELDVIASAAPLRDRDGCIVGAVGVVRDQTEHKRLEREREEARAKAERQAEQLDRIFEQMSEGVAIYDEQGLLVRVNAAQRRLLSLDAAPSNYFQTPMRQRVQPTWVRDLWGNPVAPDDWPVRRALRGESLSEAYAVDMRLRTFDGREIEVTTSAAPVRDRTGRIVGAVSVVLDQTERRRLEREREAAHALAERQAEELDRIFEAVADGLVVFDRHGRSVRANVAMWRLLGQDAVPPEYAQMSLHERMALFAARDVHNRPLGLDEGPLPRALAGKLTAGAETMDIRSRTFDGREVDLSVTATTLRDREGAAIGAVCVFRDQTEHQRLQREREAARAAAERQAQQLDELVEAIVDGVVAYDVDGRLVHVNEAARRLLGVVALPPDVYERPVAERASLCEVRDEHGEMLAPEHLPIMRVLRGEVLTGIDAPSIHIRTPEGREVDLTVSGAPVRDEASQITGAVCIYRDETERKRLEREREAARSDAMELREVNWRMDAFLAIASHDVRAPVTIAVAALQLARSWVRRLVATLGIYAGQADSPLDSPRGLPAPLTPDAWAGLVELGERVQEVIIAADQSVDRLSHMVTLLFDTVQARAGRMELHRIPADLLALVRRQVEGLRQVVPGRQIVLEAPDLPTLEVLLDVDRIGQVLTNYLTNALKYSPASRAVVVRVQAVAGYVSVAVRDEGPGLPVEEQGLVWQMFHRASNVKVQSTAGEGLGLGLGLGLHICKRIIEEHGGEVGVESQVDEGSTFWFTLPLDATAGASGQIGQMHAPEAEE